MDNFLRGLIVEKYKIGKFTFYFMDVLLIASITIVGLMIRFSLKDVVTTDWTVCLEPWISTMREWGSIKVLSGDFYNYTPPYMCVLYLISRMPFNPLYMVKLVSCLFDVILAVICSMCIFEVTASRVKSAGAYALLMIVPTVAANGAMWAQCDVIYVTFLALCVLFLLKEKPFWALLFFGIAFALKLQALFLFPFLVLLWAKNKIKIQHFLFIPIMYLVGILPAWLAGRSFFDLLNIYVSQGQTENWVLSWLWPNVYQLLGTESYPSEYSSAGIYLTIGLLICILYYGASKKYEITKEFTVFLALFFSVLIPFFLPYMHERYGYLADILAILYGIINIRKFYIPVIHILLSYTAYTAYLTGNIEIPFAVYTFAMLFILIDLGISVFKKINSAERAVIKVI